MRRNILHPAKQSKRRAGGSALIVTVLVLTIVSFLSISGMRNSERESTSAGRSRSITRALAAADAGLQLALGQLAEMPVNLGSFDVNLADGSNVQSRARVETVPQDLDQVGLGLSSKEGFGMGIGSSGVAYVKRIYIVNTTATGGDSTVELQANLNRNEVDGVGY